MGTEFDAVVGGQYLDGITEVLISPLQSGGDLPSKGDVSTPQATFVKLVKPLTPKQANELGEKLRKIQQKVRAERRKRRLMGEGPARELLVKFAAEEGISQELLEQLEEYLRARNDPKRQPAPQIAESATIHVSLPKDTPPGMYILRLRTRNGVSEPLRFHIATWHEFTEQEPNDNGPVNRLDKPLPTVINGQAMQGDIDQFQITAKKGQRLVLAVLARELMPYLADAVPGWFQATLSVTDAAGRELAFGDDFWFHPDPVLFFEVPRDGEYIVTIKDAIYRGRQDFVYRLVVGELPFITGVFPLGGPARGPTQITLHGWNLPQREMTLTSLPKQPGIVNLPLPRWAQLPCEVPFAVGRWTEELEKEPNDSPSSAQSLALDSVLNGRIDRPDDLDVFSIQGRAGQTIVAEVLARRLYAPTDSLLRILDENGQVLAVNDDHEDKGAGLLTHYADSYLTVRLPRSGKFFIELTDAQHQGGELFAYRLRVSKPSPEFELRVVPSVVNATPGSVVPVTVYAFRKDGLEGDILLELANRGSGISLSGNWIPADQEQATITMTVPRLQRDGMRPIKLLGRATVAGRQIVRTAVPADDMTQAFYYHHLVPAEVFAINLAGRSRYSVGWTLSPDRAVKIACREKTQFELPGANPLSQNARLQLANAPDGITLEQVVSTEGRTRIILALDKQKVRPGLKGNLVFEVYNETERPGLVAGTTQTVRYFAGFLPAIPFVLE